MHLSKLSLNNVSPARQCYITVWSILFYYNNELEQYFNIESFMKIQMSCTIC